VARPAERLRSPWLSDGREARARQFLAAFTTPGGDAVHNPAPLARSDTGVDGEAPSLDAQGALEQAIAYATIDANHW
jgi:hypothetical protein